MHKTDEDLEATVRAFLKNIGLEHQVRPDMMTVISKLKRVVPTFAYRRVPDHKMPDAYAQWNSDDFELRMRESTFIGIQRDEPRARMSVAHELSHYLHRHKGLLNRSLQKSGTEVEVQRYINQESEARRTAPIILAPEYLIPEYATVDIVETKFGLSHQAAVLRKEEIDGIRRRRRGEPRPLPQSIIDYLKEARRRGVPIRTDLGD
jgi:Zn-dependent peptidase ImmA (M78 family)